MVEEKKEDKPSPASPPGRGTEECIWCSQFELNFSKKGPGRSACSLLSGYIARNLSHIYDYARAATFKLFVLQTGKGPKYETHALALERYSLER
jgi:hypothetical protein